MWTDSTLGMLEENKVLPRVQGDEPRVPATWEGAALGRRVTETPTMCNGAAEKQMTISEIRAH